MTSASKKPLKKFRPIRVLFIVDSIYWVISNFFQQIKKDNPKLEAQICSQFAIRKTIKRFGGFTPTFDVMHILRTNPIKPFEGEYPIVSTLHHVDSGTKLALLDKSDVIMTVSTQWYNYLIKMGIPSHKLGIVPFGVDSKVFHPPNSEERRLIRRSLNLSKEAFVIGFSARRTSDADGRKGIGCFVQALKLANQQFPNVATVIIGPGWQHLARELQMEEINCSLIPYHIDHEQIAKFYGAMDVFWVTAKIEGGPIPLLEAMASGIPCISTPVGAALDLIKNDQNGFMVPFDSPDKFASLSSQLEANKDLGKRLGMEARNTILQERTWSQSQQKILELYELTIKNFESNSFQGTTQGPKDQRTKKNGKPSQVLPPAKPDLFSPTIEKWMAACEHLNGLRMVLEMGEWWASIQIGFRALRIAPFDHYVWLEFFKILKKQLKKKA
ncbi:MAG: glycosyltransferase family 4 protein [Nitrospirales bacterium]